MFISRGMLVIVASFALLGMPIVKAVETVDLLLVLAADISKSMNPMHFKLQRKGYADALTSPAVLSAIALGNHRRIGVVFVEWSNILQQRVIIDWSIIDGQQSAERFASVLSEAPRPFSDYTAIGEAIDFSVRQLARAPFTADPDRKVIDVSGDGNSNMGRPVHDMRDEAVKKDIVINGIVILSQASELDDKHTNPPGGLPNYYKENVIGGPGSFLMVATDFASFGKAMTMKLVKEIAGLSGRILKPSTPSIHGELDGKRTRNASFAFGDQVVARVERNEQRSSGVLGRLNRFRCAPPGNSLRYFEKLHTAITFIARASISPRTWA
jgi:hypothetical protein